MGYTGLNMALLTVCEGSKQIRILAGQVVHVLPCWRSRGGFIFTH